MSLLVEAKPRSPRVIQAQHRFRSEAHDSVLNRQWTATDQVDEQTRLAFDVSRYVGQYEQLVSEYGDKEARAMMLVRVKQEMMTYLGELAGVGYFAYAYQIDETGELVEDSSAQRPLREIMAAFPSVESTMWQEQMIPMLEWLPVGASAFAMSVRKPEEVVEGSHDYAYFFIKTDTQTIEASALELNLTTTQSRAILNRQIGHEFLDENSSWEVMRSQAFFYPQDYYSNPSHALVDIVGGGLVGQVPDELKTPSRLESYFSQQQQLLKQDKQTAFYEAGRVVDGLAKRDSASLIQADLAAIEQAIMLREYRDLITQALDWGMEAIVLPCGLVNLQSPAIQDFSVTSPVMASMGEGVVSLMECVECPFCHQTVDAIVTATKIKCTNPTCLAEVDKKAA